MSPWRYLGAGQVPGHGSHNGFCPTCTDNGILHIIIACNGPQGTQHLLHKVLYGWHKGVTPWCSQPPSAVPGVNCYIAALWEGIWRVGLGLFSSLNNS